MDAGQWTQTAQPITGRVLAISSTWPPACIPHRILHLLAPRCCHRRIITTIGCESLSSPRYAMSRSLLSAILILSAIISLLQHTVHAATAQPSPAPRVPFFALYANPSTELQQGQPVQLQWYCYFCDDSSSVSISSDGLLIVSSAQPNGNVSYTPPMTLSNSSSSVVRFNATAVTPQQTLSKSLVLTLLPLQPQLTLLSPTCCMPADPSVPTFFDWSCEQCQRLPTLSLTWYCNSGSGGLLLANVPTQDSGIPVPRPDSLVRAAQQPGVGLLRHRHSGLGQRSGLLSELQLDQLHPVVVDRGQSGDACQVVVVQLRPLGAACVVVVLQLRPSASCVIIQLRSVRAGQACEGVVFQCRLGIDPLAQAVVPTVHISLC